MSKKEFLALCEGRRVRTMEYTTTESDGVVFSDIPQRLYIKVAHGKTGKAESVKDLLFTHKTMAFGKFIPDTAQPFMDLSV